MIETNEIELGGRKLKVHYGTNAVREIEMTLDKSIFELLRELREEEGLGVNEIVVIVWAGLLKHLRQITPEQVGDLFDEDPSSIDSAAETCAKALAQAMIRYIRSPQGTENEEKIPGKN